MARDLRQIRKVMGVPCDTQDARVWEWNLDGVRYNWCAVGQLRAPDSDYSGVVAFVRSLAQAVALTVGYHDGRECAGRTNLHKT